MRRNEFSTTSPEVVTKPIQLRSDWERVRICDVLWVMSQAEDVPQRLVSATDRAATSGRSSKSSHPECLLSAPFGTPSQRSACPPGEGALVVVP